MALDANGAYYPSFGDVSYPASTRGTLRHGAGVPSNDLGQNGDIYVNITNGDIYTKNGDVYELQVGGSGGSVQVIPGAVDDPNVGAIVPDDPSKGAFYYRDSAGNNAVQLWRWSVADQNWKDLITT